MGELSALGPCPAPLALCPPSHTREAAHRAGEPLGVSRGSGRTAKGIIWHGAEGTLGCVGAEQHKGCLGSRTQAFKSCSLSAKSCPALARCLLRHEVPEHRVSRGVHSAAQGSREQQGTW